MPLPAQVDSLAYVNTTDEDLHSRGVIGPYMVGSAIYTLLYDNSTGAYHMEKSTDGGNTWSRVATSGSLTNSFTIAYLFRYGTDLIAVWGSTFTQISFKKFDTTTDTWGTAVSFTVTDPSNVCCLGNGEILIHYIATVQSVMGNGYTRTAYRRYSISGNTIGAEVLVNQDGTQVNYALAPIVYIASSNRVHIFYERNNFDIRHRSSTAGGTLSAETLLGSWSGNTQWENFHSVWIPFVNNGISYIGHLYCSATTVTLFYAQDAAAISSFTGVQIVASGDTALPGTQFSGKQLVYESGQGRLYAIWATYNTTGGRADIWLSKNDSGTNLTSWTEDTKIQDVSWPTGDVDVVYVRAEVKDSNKISYLFKNTSGLNGSTYYNEYTYFAAGPQTHYGIVTREITFGKSVAARKQTFGQIGVLFTFGKAVAGIRVGPTQYGVVVFPVTFSKTVSGQRKTFGQLVFPITFSKTVSGQRKTFGQVAMPLIFTKTVAGRKTVFGQTTFPITIGISTSGIKPVTTHYGALTLPIIFSKDVSGQRKTFGQLLSPFLFSKDVRAQRKTFGQIAFPINASIATSGIRLGLTQYGIIALPVTFVKDVRGQRKTFGQIARPLTFGKDVKGQRKTFGQITFPITFIKEAVGRKQIFGQLSMQTLFGKETAGRRRTFSQIAFPLTFSKVVSGQRKTFGQIAFPINFLAFVDGQASVGPKTYYGSIVMPLAFGKQVSAYRKTFGQIFAPYIVGKAVQGRRQTFSKIDFPIDLLTYAESGYVETHGKVSLPIDFLSFVDGQAFVPPKTYYGSLSMPITFDKQIAAQRKAFGQIVAPFIFGKTAQGRRQTFGEVEFLIDLLTYVESGYVETHGELSLPIIVQIDTAGVVRPQGIILNLAEMIYLGTEPVLAVYVEEQKVWPTT